VLLLSALTLVPRDNRFVYLLKNADTLPHFCAGITANVDARDSIFERRVEERQSLTSGRDGSEAHLSAPEIRQIFLGRTTLEVNFEVHGGEVGG